MLQSKLIFNIQSLNIRLHKEYLTQRIKSVILKNSIGKERSSNTITRALQMGKNKSLLSLHGYDTLNIKFHESDIVFLWLELKPLPEFFQQTWIRFVIKYNRYKIHG